MPYPWRRVLVPTDFSTAAAWAFDDAIRMAAATSAELIILHVRMTKPSNPSELRFPVDPALYDYAERLELENLQQRVERHDVALQTRLLVRSASDAGREICRTASDENVDLVVISTHARHHVARWIIGSTTLRVASDPKTPVLSVRYGIRKRGAMRKIVIAAHPGQRSDAAAVLAGAMAAREQAEVHLISVADRAGHAASEAFLDQLANRVLHGVAVTRRVIDGRDVEREILRYCESAGTDMVAIGHDIDGTEEHPIGPTAAAVIRKSDVPVLIVPGARV
jgi:universal stress protein A